MQRSSNPSLVTRLKIARSRPGCSGWFALVLCHATHSVHRRCQPRLRHAKLPHRSGHCTEAKTAAAETGTALLPTCPGLCCGKSAIRRTHLVQAHAVIVAKASGATLAGCRKGGLAFVVRLLDRRLLPGKGLEGDVHDASL